MRTILFAVWWVFIKAIALTSAGVLVLALLVDAFVVGAGLLGSPVVVHRMYLGHTIGYTDFFGSFLSLIGGFIGVIGMIVFLAWPAAFSRVISRV